MQEWACAALANILSNCNAITHHRQLFAAEPIVDTAEDGGAEGGGAKQESYISKKGARLMREVRSDEHIGARTGQ
jgi:hypothetical protein